MLPRLAHSLALAASLIVAAAACSKQEAPQYAEQPLPPASGTPVGYLLDNAGQLSLTDEQMTKLRQIDTSLSARNDAIDTQLRSIETPEPIEEDPKNPSATPPNMAPGAQPLRTTKDAGKLHEARKDNNKEALEKAFALLDASQQTTARKLLDARGISSPKSPDAPKQAEPPAEEQGGEPMPAHEP